MWKTPEDHERLKEVLADLLANVVVVADGATLTASATTSIPVDASIRFSVLVEAIHLMTFTE